MELRGLLSGSVLGVGMAVGELHSYILWPQNEAGQ